MKKKQGGFTLIEVIICIIIFAVLLDGLWGVFGNVQFEFGVFRKQVELDNDMEGIESFVKTYIREADKVSVVVKESGSGEVEIMPDTNMEEKYEDLELVKIKLTKVLPDGTEVNSTIEYDNTDRELTYTSEGTPSLIADEVNNIKVTRKKGSNVIEFNCELSKEITEVNVGDERKKVDGNFSESISYK